MAPEIYFWRRSIGVCFNKDTCLEDFSAAQKWFQELVECNVPLIEEQFTVKMVTQSDR